MTKYITLVTLVLLGVIMLAQAPVPATVSELERLKLVNAWQKAIIAQVDFQAAQARMQAARDAWFKEQTDTRAAHKWDDATTFEINADTGAVTVHLPPADKKPSPAPKEDKK